jgi:hypothetical protein
VAGVFFVPLEPASRRWLSRDWNVCNRILTAPEAMIIAV